MCKDGCNRHKTILQAKDEEMMLRRVQGLIEDVCDARSAPREDDRIDPVSNVRSCHSDVPKAHRLIAFNWRLNHSQVAGGHRTDPNSTEPHYKSALCPFCQVCPSQATTPPDVYPKGLDGGLLIRGCACLSLT